MFHEQNRLTVLTMELEKASVEEVSSPLAISGRSLLWDTYPREVERYSCGMQSAIEVELSTTSFVDFDIALSDLVGAATLHSVSALFTFRSLLLVILSNFVAHNWFHLRFC
jgi:hypothetical protein